MINPESVKQLRKLISELFFYIFGLVAEIATIFLFVKALIQILTK